MATYDRDEVEAVFQHYWKLGAVGEDWDAWVDECFTDDVTYVEHVLGNMSGREEVRAWIKPIMEDYGELYTAYEWHQIGDDGRVVAYMQNRRDNPEAGGPPIDFPGITVLHYAGDGRFSLEEDFWSYPGAIQASKQYEDAVNAHDPEHKAKRTRLHWGEGPEWTQGPGSYAESLGAARA
jgi:limonene-1,2-epoxide hydrolase